MIGGNPYRLAADVRKRAQAEARKIRTISIYCTREGYYSVHEGEDLVADMLGWDEMLGQIALMTIGPRLAGLIGRGPYSHPIDVVLHRMERRAEHERRRAEHERRRVEDERRRAAGLPMLAYDDEIPF